MGGARGGVGENVGVSNPYAPPEDRPSSAPDDGAASQGAPQPGAPQPGTPPHGAPQQGHPTAPGGQPGPEAGWGMPPGQRPVAPPSRDTTPPDPEQVAALARQGRTFAALMVAAVLTSSFPVPWQAAGLVFTVLALVVGVRALIRAIRLRVRGTLTGLLIGGVGVSAFWFVVSIGMALMWPIYVDRQECLAGALTISARQECETQFRQSVEEWVERFETRTRP